MFSLLALAIFIVWDSRQMRSTKARPLSREKMVNGFMPRDLVDWHVWIGFGAVCGLLALLELDRPSAPPFSGRWSWLYQIAFDVLGARGSFFLWLALSVVLLICGFSGWLRSKKKAP